MTLAALVQTGIRALGDAGFAPDDSRRDAAALGRGVLAWDLSQWIARQHDAAPPGFGDAFRGAVLRRTRHEPVAYILGAREFYGRRFTVTPAVLIPRPETELLVDRALHVIDETAPGSTTVLDVGTGSGCVAVTIACERPATTIIATDTSAGALAVAAENAAAHGVGARIRFLEASLAAGLEAAVDLVVSNPPYVAEADRASLAADVREWEPDGALFGGPDGLDVIRALIPAAKIALRPGGALLIEAGLGQAETVGRLLAATGFTGIRWHADLAGIPRVVIARLGDRL